jgi:hypothetical protein
VVPPAWAAQPTSPVDGGPVGGTLGVGVGLVGGGSVVGTGVGLVVPPPGSPTRPTPDCAVTTAFMSQAVCTVYGYDGLLTLPPVWPAPELIRQLFRATSRPSPESASPRWYGSSTFSK